MVLGQVFDTQTCKMYALNAMEVASDERVCQVHKRKVHQDNVGWRVYSGTGVFFCPVFDTRFSAPTATLPRSLYLIMPPLNPSIMQADILKAKLNLLTSLCIPRKVLPFRPFQCEFSRSDPWERFVHCWVKILHYFKVI